MVFQPGQGVGFVGEGAVELGLEGGIECFLEAWTGSNPQRYEMAAEQQGPGRSLGKRERGGAGVEFRDACKCRGRMEGRAAIVIGTHDDAELVDGGWGEFTGETADAVVGEVSLAAMMREMKNHERSDVFDEIAWSADTGEECFAERAAGGFMAGTYPAEFAATLGIGGCRRFSEVVREYGEEKLAAELSGCVLPGIEADECIAAVSRVREYIALRVPLGVLVRAA